MLKWRYHIEIVALFVSVLVECLVVLHLAVAVQKKLVLECSSPIVHFPVFLLQVVSFPVVLLQGLPHIPRCLVTGITLTVLIQFDVALGVPFLPQCVRGRIIFGGDLDLVVDVVDGRVGLHIIVGGDLKRMLEEWGLYFMEHELAESGVDVRVEQSAQGENLLVGCALESHLWVLL